MCKRAFRKPKHLGLSSAGIRSVVLGRELAASRNSADVRRAPPRCYIEKLTGFFSKEKEVPSITTRFCRGAILIEMADCPDLHRTRRTQSYGFDQRGQRPLKALAKQVKRKTSRSSKLCLGGHLLSQLAGRRRSEALRFRSASASRFDPSFTLLLLKLTVLMDHPLFDYRSIDRLRKKAYVEENQTFPQPPFERYGPGCEVCENRSQRLMH
jgi:hypothetical protein